MRNCWNCPSPCWYRRLWRIRSTVPTRIRFGQSLSWKRPTGPTAAEADPILNDKGVVIVPDILSNAGGVVVSYFEWVQNIQSVSWTEEEVNAKLERIMNNSFDAVYNIAQEKKVPLRTGAYLIAVDRVVKAKKARAIWP